ncbi:MAG: CaiB/BaiF CoA-transferase family protein [Pseudolabrys sp.]
MTLPLEGLLVVSLEQAVAAPQCTCRMADAGARVIKVERPEGDFAREYDHIVHGESAHLVWLNVVFLGEAEAAVGLHAHVGGGPGRVGRQELRHYPKLICCSISGYGESGPYAQRKAYDLLIQAESGISSVTGGPEAPARVGVSIVDIGAGLNAYEAILEALIARGRTGEGAEVSISMFDAMAEWMTIPLLNEEWGNPFKRVGLAHPTIAPYGVFKTRDGADILIAIQNDREWRVLADKVLGDAALGTDERFATNPKRNENRAVTDAAVAAVFARHDVEPLMAVLEKADIAFARVNDAKLLATHPHLRRITVDTESGPALMPAPAVVRAGAPRTYGAVPALGAHSEMIKKEFGG